MEKLYTYLMFDGKLYKIGQTGDVKKRMQAMYTANPYIQLIGYSDKISEKELHNRFSNYRVKLEWFNLFDCQVDDILFAFQSGSLTTQDHLWYLLRDKCRYFNKYDSKQLRTKIENQIQKDIPTVKCNIFNLF
jgi:hypothetical protein